MTPHFKYGFEYGRCLAECPAGHFKDDTFELDSGTVVKMCLQCHPACQECLENETGDGFESPLDGYDRCCGKLCSNGYFQVDLGLEKIQCVKRCPDGYYPTDANRCIEKWTVIGYQDEAINNTLHVVAGQFDASIISSDRPTGLEYGAKTEPLTTFFDLKDGISNWKAFFTRFSQPTLGRLKLILTLEIPVQSFWQSAKSLRTK